ncbi:MAG: hypothetical protein JSV82_05525 [Planctomycetota bacterium]|nr:MAG: hypothetical protein JSV82_05525 [Planctomycetota bacterium]
MPGILNLKDGLISDKDMRLREINLLKLCFIWLSFLTLFCFTNSVLTIVFQFYGPEKGLSFAFLLPFAHMASVILGIMFYALGLFLFKGRTIGYRNFGYIWENYPDIAKQIDPDGVYARDPASSKYRGTMLILGIIFSIFALVIWFRPNRFKDAFSLWLQLPTLFLIVGIVVLVLYRLYLRIFKGEQYAKEHFERMKQKSIETQKQFDDYERPRRRRLFRSKQEVNAMKAFIRGRFDDGSDRKLNQIKLSIKYLPWLMLWAFLLSPVVWIFNIALLAVFCWSK